MRKLDKILEKFLLYLILFLFVFIPLYPKFPLFNVAGTFVAIRLEDLVIGLTLGLWAIYLVISNQLRIFLKDKLNLAILLFFFVAAVSIFSANFLTHTVTLHISILHYLRRIEFLLLLPVVASVVKNKRDLILIMIFLAITATLVNIYALGQIYFDWPVISTSNSEFSKGLILRLTPGARANSTFAGHYDLAVYLAMAISLLTAIFFSVSKKLKFGVLSLGILSLVVLIMTAARLAFVAAFIGIILSLLFSKKTKYILFILFIAAAILIYPSQLRDRLISTVTVNLFSQGQRYVGQTTDQQVRSKLNIPTLAVKTSSTSGLTSTFASSSGQTATDITPGEPIDTTQLGVYRSFEIRLKVEWPRAVTAFIKNSLLGTGYSSIDIATDNDFLRSLGEVGLLGTLALILVLVEIAKRIFFLLKSESKLVRFFSAGVLSMFFTFIINGLFIDVFEASKVASLFWMMLGLNLAVLRFK
ncbi:MAG: O-antigen ligase family protein [Candidatus Daviesbacteria bacterium]|nr:O-antigen ligase family protein [Candidatus Daviesbacteria bacterium]